jgi:hypothetical protein
MTGSKFAHLYLADWPFQVVPDHRFSRIWADRSDLREIVKRLLRKMARTPQASIHLMWAWYGAGKSHTLRHMTHLCEEKYPQLHPVYTVFPKSVSSFLSLYQTLMRNLEMTLLVERYAHAARHSDSEHLRRILNMPSDMLTVLKYLCIGDDKSKDIAQRWLRGERPHMSTLRSMGINSRIEKIDDAIRSLRCITALISLNHEDDRIIWMIDEFQRIGDLKNSVRAEINTSLHSVFNECPTNFSLILSFSVRNRTTIDAMLSPALLDRTQMQQVITIPPLTMDQASVFVTDLLKTFRSADHSPPSIHFPFEESALNAILEYLEADPNIELKPRSIMQACDLIMGEADWDIQEKKLDIISRDYALAILTQRSIDTQSDLS